MSKDNEGNGTNEVNPLPKEYEHLGKMAEETMKIVLNLEKSIQNAKEPAARLVPPGTPPPLSKAAQQAEFKRQQVKENQKLFDTVEHELKDADPNVREEVVKNIQSAMNVENAVAKEKEKEARKANIQEEIRDTKVFDDMSKIHFEAKFAKERERNPKQQEKADAEAPNQQEARKPSRSQSFTMGLRYEQKLFQDQDISKTKDEDKQQNPGEQNPSRSELYSKSLSYSVTPPGVSSGMEPEQQLEGTEPDLDED